VYQTAAVSISPKDQSEFWDRLEEASRDVGLPCGLSDIGRELDLWPSAVQKWRDGLNYPGQKNLNQLAINRGVNTEWLKTGRGPKLAEGAMDSSTRELLKLWTSLPPEARDRLLGAARYEHTVQENQQQSQIPLPNNPSPPFTKRPK
jgi:hypothetical protein